MATLVNYTCKRFIRLTPDDKFYHIYSDFVTSASGIPDTLKYPKMQHIHGMHPVGCKEQSIDLNIFKYNSLFVWFLWLLFKDTCLF